MKLTSVLSCSLCGQLVPREHLDDARASLSAGTLLCQTCLPHASPPSGLQLPLRTAPARLQIMGPSPAMERLRASVQRFGPLEVPVLITGETGTGKELVAEALHQAGPRRLYPLLAVNCGAIPLTLLESELFGYERGAFTGAVRAHRGLFEQAGAGSILLDEIGDISPQLQIALLRVLERAEVRPVGATATRPIACRVLAATNADLEAKARRGEFRLDLLYRLQRVRLHLPALRERAEDIVPLALYFLNRQYPRIQAAFTPTLERVLRDYDWPGNVRQLNNVIEQMALTHPNQKLYDVAQISEPLQAPTLPVQAPAACDTADSAGGLPRLEHGNSRLRRLKKIRALFSQHQTLTRAEIAGTLGICHNTVTHDLKLLCAEGLVRRVMPSASPRSCYFELCRPHTEAAPGAPAAAR